MTVTEVEQGIIRGRLGRSFGDRLVLIDDGWDSRVVDVGGEWIFRFARRPAVWRSLRLEAALLPRLAAVLPLAVPRFEHVGDEHEPFVAYRKLPGEGLSAALLAGVDPGAVARQVGEFLRALHRFPSAEASALGVPDDDRFSTPDGWYRQVRERIFPLLEEDVRDRAARHFERFLGDEANFRFRPVLVHGDLDPQHVLCAPSGAVTGVIDWGDAGIGDPANDLGGFLTLGRSFAAAVLDAYGDADPTVMARAAFFRSLAPFYQVAYGLGTGRRQHLTGGLAQLHTRFRAQAQRATPEAGNHETLLACAPCT